MRLSRASSSFLFDPTYFGWFAIAGKSVIYLWLLIRDVKTTERVRSGLIDPVGLYVHLAQAGQPVAPVDMFS
jgi:hypothetical protein